MNSSGQQKKIAGKSPVQLFTIAMMLFSLFSCVTGSEDILSVPEPDTSASAADPSPAESEPSSSAPQATQAQAKKADGELSLGASSESIEEEFAEDIAVVSVAEEPAAEQERSEPEPVEPTTLYLSADDSNSAASPVIVRQLIRGHRYVPTEIVRTYEFLNYYTFSYDAAEDSDVEIYPHLTEKEDGAYYLQTALRSQDSSYAALSPFRFTFLVDTSGSMAGRPLELAKETLLQIVGMLRAGDVVSVVVFNRTTAILLEKHAIFAGSKELFRSQVLPQISANDITDIQSGILRAYEVASSMYDYRALNRVILLSDGGANAGELSSTVIARYAEDSDKQGIYLAGIGFGEGFNDSLMDAVTDGGRGAYLFVDGEKEIQRITDELSFPANFDLSIKDVRLKMVMPANWTMQRFYGEQVSAVASEVIPQYLSPNDQMIYSATLLFDGKNENTWRDQEFEFEVEYRPLGGSRQTKKIEVPVSEMLRSSKNSIKGEAIVSFAEMLKGIEYPPDLNLESNQDLFDKTAKIVQEAAARYPDAELDEILSLMVLYGQTLKNGERFPESRDWNSDSVAAVLGLSANSVRSEKVTGPQTDMAIRAMERLNDSTRLVPMEGYRFLGLSSGPVGNRSPAGGGELSSQVFNEPQPDFHGYLKADSGTGQAVFDLHQIIIELQAPADARCFSFDFNFFSAEYPDFINQSFNDSFYAILQAQSTNKGQRTNIAFDSNNDPIEVDSNYFQNPFHPIPNRGTGFDRNGSTGWLRTHWPIQPGEIFTLTFTVHDESDAIYDSLAILDNFQWHAYEAVGTTDPLN